MEVRVKIRTLTIKDPETQKEFLIKTVRTLEEIFADLEESEKEAIRCAVETTISEAIAI